MLTTLTIILCPTHLTWLPQSAPPATPLQCPSHDSPTGEEKQAFFSVFFNSNKVLELCFVSCVFLGVWGYGRMFQYSLL